MTTYTFLNQGAAPTFEPGMVAVFMKNINIPDLVTNGGLATTANVATSLPSTGFAAADVLQVFDIPAGYHIKDVGVRVTTVEGGTSTISVGVTSATQTHSLAADTDGFIATLSINALATTISGPDVGYGTASGKTCGQVYVTDGTLDILFNTASTETAVFDIWASGIRVW